MHGGVGGKQNRGGVTNDGPVAVTYRSLHHCCEKWYELPRTFFIHRSKHYSSEVKARLTSAPSVHAGLKPTGTLYTKKRG